MTKIIGPLTLGLVITLSGCISGYFYFLYLINISDSSSSVMLLLSAILLVSIGLYFLHKAIASMMNLNDPEQTDSKHAWFENSTHPIASTLQNNSEMIKDWTKTNKTREELKVLEAAAAIEEPKKRF